MNNFLCDVDDFFFQEKGIHLKDLAYMEMPKEKGRYILSKVIGNANLTEGRFKINADADAIIDTFLSMSLK